MNKTLIALMIATALAITSCASVMQAWADIVKTAGGLGQEENPEANRSSSSKTFSSSNSAAPSSSSIAAQKTRKN
ncbi:MAG: hypothetical protein FWB90_09480 [Fibromonadales bacterium]|nr:hypothetical protein [Fibromonadales bacterium]